MKMNTDHFIHLVSIKKCTLDRQRQFYVFNLKYNNFFLTTNEEQVKYALKITKNL